MRWLKKWFAGILILWVVGVALYSTSSQHKSSAYVSGSTDLFTNLYSNSTAQDLNRMHEYAMLSDAAYLTETSVKAESIDKKKKSYNELVQFRLNPDVSDRAESALLNLWEKFDDKIVQDALKAAGINDKNKSCFVKAQKNFGMVVYHRVRPNQNNKTEIALVYRGTDDTSDFFSNLHWLTRFIPNCFNQYDIARTLTPDIVKAVLADLQLDIKDAEFIAAGHSLGGGLAQVVGYSNTDVDKVFAFDASAVTGFFDINRGIVRENVKELRIYRIHAWGEVLAYMRNFMRLIWPVVTIDPQIIEIRFRIPSEENSCAEEGDTARSNSVSKHSMCDLAIGIRDVWLEHGK